MKRFVQTEIRIRSSAEEILDHFIDPAKLNGWWGVEDTFIQPRDGGLYTLVWGKSQYGARYVSSGQIKFLNPREFLHLEKLLYFNPHKPIIGPTSLNYDVEEHNAYSILRIKQSGFEKGGYWDWYYQVVQASWPDALTLLKKFIEKQDI